MTVHVDNIKPFRGGRKQEITLINEGDLNQQEQTHEDQESIQIYEVRF